MERESLMRQAKLVCTYLWKDTGNKRKQKLVDMFGLITLQLFHFFQMYLLPYHGKEIVKATKVK